METKNIDILKLLFEVHHRQLAARRVKIHGITEKTLTLYMIIAGWLVLTTNTAIHEIRYVIIGLVIAIAVVQCRSIYKNNQSYYDIFKVIGRINNTLSLHEGKTFGVAESIYPEKWKTSGNNGELEGALNHIVPILSGALFCVIVTFLKA